MVRRILSVVAAASACAGSPPASAPAERPREKPRSGGLPLAALPQVTQELGSIDARAVEVTQHRLEPRLEQCHAEARRRVDVLAGDVRVFLRIDPLGNVRRSHLEESTLGDVAAERCIMTVLSSARWPRPQGGDAEVRHTFGWGPGAERPPTVWGPENVTSAVIDSKEAKKEIEKCKAGEPRSFALTAYVAPDGPRHGKFQAIGGVAPTPDAEKKIECLVEALMPLKLPSPGEGTAKVSFSL